MHASSCGLPGPLRRRHSGKGRGRVMGGFDSEPGYWCWEVSLHILRLDLVGVGVCETMPLTGLIQTVLTVHGHYNCTSHRRP